MSFQQGNPSLFGASKIWVSSISPQFHLKSKEPNKSTAETSKILDSADQKPQDARPPGTAREEHPHCVEI